LKNSLKSKSKTEKDYENLGRIVASVYESGYLDAAKSYKMAFFKGILQGLGGAIGATLILAFLLWLLSLFSDLWFIGDIVEKIEMSISER
jgi:hypothetical protein